MKYIKEILSVRRIHMPDYWLSISFKVGTHQDMLRDMKQGHFARTWNRKMLRGYERRRWWGNMKQGHVDGARNGDMLQRQFPSWDMPIFAKTFFVPATCWLILSWFKFMGHKNELSFQFCIVCTVVANCPRYNIEMIPLHVPAICSP